jgi:hypothetical protein
MRRQPLVTLDNQALLMGETTERSEVKCSFAKWAQKTHFPAFHGPTTGPLALFPTLSRQVRRCRNGSRA